MIDPRELRIGNLIMTDDGIICSVENIESKNFTKWDSGNDYSIVGLQIGTENNYLNCINDTWKPITLTEEILLKCPQVRKKSFWYYIDLNDWTKISIHFYKGKCVVELSVQKHSLVIPCDFLHQLSNLFYSLTGQELEIKL